MTDSPLWIAPRHGQDWRDEDVLAAIRWMTEPLDSSAWTARLERVRSIFESAKLSWAAGDRVPLFDPEDTAAWYVFQANAYAADRGDWVEPEAFRIAPVFMRLGQLLTEFGDIAGAQERAARILTDGRRQPDDGLYELLVAGAYKRRGWRHVAFVPEEPGGRRRHDLAVAGDRRRWAVECKRVGRSGYAAEEHAAGTRLAANVHQLCRQRRRSVVIEVAFNAELSAAGDDYLAERAQAYFDNPAHNRWDDEIAEGQLREVAWPLLNAVMSRDDVYFGSSRMIQLAAGDYFSVADHSMDGDWTPGRGRPFHAYDVRQLSLVSWLSRSREAMRRKATHFRRMVAGALGQLPGDRPGVVHVGYELVGGNGADGRRDLLNRLEMLDFDVGVSRLRWVYGNYMVPEHTTARMESAALTETTATYPVGRPTTRDPLPEHVLFSDGIGIPGAYWAGLGPR